MLIYPFCPFFLYFGKLTVFVRGYWTIQTFTNVFPWDESLYNSIHPHKHTHLTNCELWFAMSRGHSNRTCHLFFFRSNSAPSAVLMELLCVIQPLSITICDAALKGLHVTVHEWWSVIPWECYLQEGGVISFKLDLVIES